MSGLIATVLLRSSFTPHDTGRVTRILRSVADNVTETRKGRHWSFIVENAVASLSVLSTSEHACDFEDQLLERDMLFEDAPDAFLIAFGTRRECDHETCSRLAVELAKAFDGVNCGFGG